MNVTMQVLFVTYLLCFVSFAVAYQKQKALTYNTGLLDRSLLPGVIPNNRVERRDAIINALQQSDYDLVCLQEVWLGKDTEAIVDGLSNKFSYSYSALHNEDGTLPPQSNTIREPVCNYTRMLALAVCLDVGNCLQPNIDDALACITIECEAEYSSIVALDGQQCVSCNGIRFPEFVSIFKYCTAEAPASGLDHMNEPGLLLLSKRPLTNTAHVDYFPTTTEIINRGYLTATFDGKTTAVCTHLTTIFDFYAELQLIPLGFTSYVDQREHEVNILIQMFSGVTKLILMGDFNTGPEGITGDQDEIQFKRKRCYFSNACEDYNLLKTAFRTKSVDSCTYCDGTENIYNNDSMTIDNLVRDHFFFGVNMKFRKIERVFDQLVVPDESGNQNQLPMSDHFWCDG